MAQPQNHVVAPTSCHKSLSSICNNLGYSDKLLVGYVANSVHTVPKGCCSAGRIYDSFAESIQGLVRFVTKDLAIVEIDQQ